MFNLNRVIGSHQTLPSSAMSDSEKVPLSGTVSSSEETLHPLRSAKIQLSRTASESQATLNRLVTRSLLARTAMLDPMLSLMLALWRTTPLSAWALKSAEEPRLNPMVSSLLALLLPRAQLFHQDRSLLAHQRPTFVT